MLYNGSTMKLKKVFQKKVATVSKLYEKLPKEENIEDLHQYRVNIRKLQSYLEVYEENFSAKVNAKISKLLKILLKPTSVVRDLDLFLLEIEKLDFSSDTKEKLSNLFMFKREKIFDDLIHNKRYKKSLKKLNSIVKESSFNAKELKKKESVEILKHMNTVIVDKCRVFDEKTPLYELHSLRKDFKKFRYAYELHQQQFTKEGILINTFSDLKEVQELFGILQDNATRLKFIKKIKPGLEEKEFEALSSYFEEQIENAREKLFHVIQE